MSACALAQAELTLTEALRQARIQRPSIAAAQNRIASARLTRSAAGTVPATRLLVGYSSLLDVGGSDDDLVLVQPIDLFGRGRAARSAGSAEVLKAEAELAIALSRLQYEVVTLYTDAAVAEALAETARLSQAIAQQLFDAIKILVDEGKMSGVQLSRVSIELERAKLTAEQKSAESFASRKRLAALINLSPGDLSLPGFPILTLREPEDWRDRRPDLMLLRAEVAADDAAERLSRLSRAPEVELQARRTPWQEESTKLGFRLQISLPLFDFGRSKNETKAAQLTVDAAKRLLSDAQRLAEGEVQAAQIEMAAAAQSVAHFELIDRQTQDLVAKLRTGFTEKAITLVELLEATRALREVEESKAEAQARLLKAQAEFLRATGQLLEARP